MNKKASIKAKVFKDNKSKCKATCTKKEINSTYVCTLTGKEIDSKYVRINVIHGFHFFGRFSYTKLLCCPIIIFLGQETHQSISFYFAHIFAV